MNKLLMKKIKNFCIFLTGLMALYALIGFVILPTVLTSKIPELIEQTTGRKAALEKIEFNPFSLELRLTNFVMQEKDLQDFVKFSNFFVNVQVWDSIAKSALVLSELKLQEPYVRLQVFKDNQFNFSDLLKGSESKQETPEQASGIFPLIIQAFDLSQGQVSIIDSQHKQVISTQLQPLNLHIDQLSTLSGEEAMLGFSVSLASGTHIQWQGEIGINPIFSKGEVEIKDLQFSQLWKIFLQDRAPFKWTGGTQDIHFTYNFTYQDNDFIFTLNDGLLRTKNLVFTANNNAQEQIKVPYFSVQGLAFDLNKQAIHIAKVESQQIAVDAWLDKAGTLSLQSLFVFAKNPDAPIKKNKSVDNSAAESPWNIRIDEIALQASKIKFTDQQTQNPVLIEISALDFGLHHYHLRTENELLMTAQQGIVKLNELSLKTEDAELIHIPNIAVNGIDFDLQKKSVKIQEVQTQSAKIKAWFDKRGIINYQTLFTAVKTTTPSVEKFPKSKDKKSPWVIELEEFKLSNYMLNFKDFTQNPPVSLQLSDVNFSLAKFSTSKGMQLPVSLDMRVNQRGSIKLSGNSILEPFSSHFKLAVEQVDIADFQPYINQFARLDFISGNLNTHGQLSLAQEKQGGLQFKYKGNVTIAKLHTRDQILNQDFLKWQQLKFNHIDFNLNPVKLKIKSINLDKPYARVTIKKDKTININDVIVSSTNKNTKKVKSNKTHSKSVYYSIREVNISGGSSDFSDYSLILPFVIKMNDLGGTIDEVSSNQKTKTEIDVSGKVFDLSPVTIKGDFNAGLDDLDLGLHFKSLPLPFISPYMVEFAGYKIEKGKMSLDLTYQIKNRKLIAKNNLLIDQLELGKKVENPNAVSLPLSLAIALLKDKDDKIIINMPLTGSLDDPEFSVGPLLFDAFVNVLTKVIASPFTAISSFLGSDADFSVVSFQPGSADLSDDQKVKLDGLRTALIDKPGLSLEIKGGAYTNQDWPAMSALALKEQLQQRRADELKKEGKMQLAEYIKLSPNEYQRLLADLFIESFPDMAKHSIFGTPKLNYPEMGEFYAVAKNMLQATMKPDANKLFILAATRARNIARYLSKEGAIDQTRLFILDGKVVLESENGELNAQLSLRAN